MKYLIFLQPPDDIIKEINNYRNSISKYVTMISKNRIHTTLMAFRGYEEDSDELLEVLNEIDFGPITSRTNELDMFANNSLVVKLDKTKSLVDLHYKIIEAIKPFVNWDEVPDYNVPLKKQKVLDEYGYPYCAEFFQPHITIAQTESNIMSYIDIDDFKGLEWRDDEMHFSMKIEDDWNVINNELTY